MQKLKLAITNLNQKSKCILRNAEIMFLMQKMSNYSKFLKYDILDLFDN